MEGDLPIWLDEQFLKLAISNGGKDPRKIVINNYTVKPAVEAGNNYCTQLFRVRVVYLQDNTSISKSFIVKAPLAEGSLAKIVVDEADLLKNEYIMYTKILPELYTISKHEFGPRTYFCLKEDVLIMDDLTKEGYIMSDRLRQLDFQHCAIFFITLAKYHAATVALHRENSQLIESNGIHPLYNDKIKNQTMKFFAKIKQSAFLAILKNMTDMENLTKTIENNENNLQNCVREMFKQKGPINVLNHGDCWTNNILFKYEADKVIDCKLIDFQIRTYGSPAIDLVYFLFTSAQSRVREQRMDELLRIYCETLNKTLSELACKERMTFQELQQELKQVSLWALTTVMYYLPMILNESDESTKKLDDNDENLKSLDINVNPVLKMFLGKKYNEVLPSACKDMIRLGLIDYLANKGS